MQTLPSVHPSKRTLVFPLPARQIGSGCVVLPKTAHVRFVQDMLPGIICGMLTREQALASTLACVRRSPK